MTLEQKVNETIPIVHDLDVGVMSMLDRFARMEEKSEVKDNEALRYLNQLGFTVKPEVKAQYVRYYFKAKKDYKEQNQEQGYGHGV